MCKRVIAMVKCPPNAKIGLVSYGYAQMDEKGKVWLNYPLTIREM